MSQINEAENPQMEQQDDTCPYIERNPNPSELIAWLYLQDARDEAATIAMLMHVFNCKGKTTQAFFGIKPNYVHDGFVKSHLYTPEVKAIVESLKVKELKHGNLENADCVYPYHMGEWIAPFPYLYHVEEREEVEFRSSKYFMLVEKRRTDRRIIADALMAYFLWYCRTNHSNGIAEFQIILSWVFARETLGSKMDAYPLLKKVVDNELGDQDVTNALHMIFKMEYRPSFMLIGNGFLCASTWDFVNFAKQLGLVLTEDTAIGRFEKRKREERKTEEQEAEKEKEVKKTKVVIEANDF